MDRLTKKQKRAITLIGTTAAVYISFKYLLPLVVPFLLALFLAHWLCPFAALLKKHLRLPVSLTVGLSLLVLFSLVLLGLGFLAEQLLSQLILLSHEFPTHLAKFELWFHDCCQILETTFHLEDGVLLLLADNASVHIHESLRTRAMPFLLSKSLPFAHLFFQTSTFLLVVFLSSILAVSELPALSRWKQVSVFKKELALLGDQLGHVGGAYLKVQGMIMAITSILCILGLTFLGNAYALLIGIGIGLLDALPLFGTGTVFFPWILFSLVTGRYFQAGTLFILYLLCYFLREILEAKLLGGKIGISPLETLASMYIGLQLFGIAGFLLGPAGLLIIKAFTQSMD